MVCSCNYFQPVPSEGVSVQGALSRARRAFDKGFRKGLSGCFWLLKILIPVSFATALLDYSGWMQEMDFALEPVMEALSLPPSAAVPILIGMTAGVYACLAAMAVLPLSTDHMTIITVFVLIAHSLPQEGIIQSRSGINFVKTTLVRMAAAIGTCWVVAACLQADSGPATASVAATSREPFLIGALLLDWLTGTLQLSAKIFIILIAVMVLIEWMKEFSLIDVFVRIFAPVLRMMGLHRRAGALWLTGIFFGLSYGGAVIVEESRDLRLSPEEIEKLQLSIGINHSMIEDPLLFLPFGINPLWLWVPRLAAAIAAVYLISFWFKVKRMFEQKPMPDE
jgi:spore maturation protein SpmB